MTRIPESYPCTYCHGDIDHACTACDPDCNCIELNNHNNNECEIDCQFCDIELLAQAKKIKEKQRAAAQKTNAQYNTAKRSAAAKKAWRTKKNHIITSQNTNQ